ncbi:MAG: LemA family protein [Thermoprotei archaeon]|nr:MAG: LemA family protein [Thermoprotei archaeon]
MWEIILLLLAVAVPVILIIYFISIYNRFVSLKNAAEASLNQIKVGLKKRLDLIAELVEATKSYAKYERETLEKITKLRTSVFATPGEVSEAEEETRRLLGQVLAVVEAYPSLRASEPVAKLMEAARSVEDEIARLRYTYNSVVQQYNTMIDTFPSSVVASMKGFKKLPYLRMPEEVERRPSLSFQV